MTSFGLRCFLIFLGVFSFINAAYADLTWTGQYRVEYNNLNSVGMADGTNKDYFLHHLRIDPKIVLLDGFELHGSLDVFNEGDYSVAGSQAGQSFGASLPQPNGAFYGADGSAALTDNQIYKVRDANLREMYLRFLHISGEFIVGRAPLDFGLGINLNSGKGEFDHWFDNRDMVSYKLLFGPISGQVFAARITDGFSSDGDAASELGAILNFAQSETGLEMGAMFVGRHTPASINVDQVASSGAAKTQRYGIFFQRKHKAGLTYALELGFNNGNLGLNAAGEEIAYKGFGGALELDYQTPISGLDLGINFGYANGQDGSEEDSLSSFAFDRNYDVGMILFNHPLGNPDLDLLGTTPYGKQGPYFGGGTYQSQNSIDTESISNAMYVAPYVAYAFDSQWKLKSQWLWAQLDQDIVNSVLYSTTNPALEVDKNLGLEWDLTLTYKPMDKLTWRTSLGAFFPGKAFEGGAQAYETETVFGGFSGLSIKFN